MRNLLDQDYEKYLAYRYGCSSFINREQYELGYSSGQKDGWSKGYHEGFELGKSEGAKLGQPLGWMLCRLLQVQRTAIKSSTENTALRRLEKTVQEIKDFPLENIEVDREAALARVKALYKECCCHFPKLEPFPSESSNKLEF